MCAIDVNKIILVDIDDTIWQLLNSWIPWINKLNGTDTKVEDVLNWHIADAFPTLTERQIFAPFNYQEFWDEIELMPHVDTYLKKLIEDGYDIYILSSSHSKDVSCKIRALKRKLPFIDDKHMIICSNKQLVRGKYLIDDGPHNLENGDYIPILFNARHNVWYNNPEVKRCYNWPEVYDYIHQRDQEEKLNEVHK